MIGGECHRFHFSASSPGLTGRSSTLQRLDFTALSLEYWIARVRA
jgi:hypothetical protein